MLPIMSQQNRIWLAPIGAIALALVLAGCGGGDDSGAATSGSASGGKAASGGASGGAEESGGAGPSSGMASGGPMMSGGGGPMMSGGGMPGMGGMGGGQQTAAASPKPKNAAPAPGFRSDPLRPWWDTTPKPPSVLSYVEPVRIAIPNSAAEEKPEGVDIQEVPNRRVAGILTGNGVYALIDDFNGNATVVKPGQVLEDGYRVASINANSVVLKKVVDNRTYTQTVPLTDAGSTSAFSGPGPGMGRPGMGMPGMPGSGGRGSGGRMGGRLGGPGAAE
jgi:hypothetical protein